MLKTANRRCPRAFWYCILEAVLDTVHIYLPLWILAWILQAVSIGDVRQFAISAALYMTVRSVTRWLTQAVQEGRISYARRCSEAEINKLYEKINRLSYETYQDGKVREQYNTALENMYYEFDYSDLIQEEAVILSNVGKTAAALWMVAALLLMPPVKDTGWGLLARPAVCVSLFVVVTALLMGMNHYRRKKKEPERANLLQNHGATENRLFYLQNSVVYAFSQYLSYRLFGMKPMLVQRMDQNSEENVVFFEKFRKIGRYVSNGYALSSALSNLLAFGLVIIKILSGALPVTMMLTFVEGLLQLHKAMFAVTGAYGKIRMAEPYFQSVEEVMQLPDASQDCAKEPVITPHKIQFEHVSYRYPGTNREAVQDVNFELAADKWHVLVGENGSGKTTLLLLLMRYLTPTSGRILFDGKDIQEMELGTYKKLFSSCFQAGGIYPVSLAENVSFAKDGTEKRIRSSLEKAGAGEKFREPEELKQSLKGRGLSGGETQKVLAARSFYKDAVFHIFDEPAASLDPISEDQLYRQIITLAEESYVLFVSHRLSVCRECGDILVMKNGTLLERGAHVELLQKEGEYASLWNAQASTYRQIFEKIPQEGASELL